MLHIKKLFFWVNSYSRKYSVSLRGFSQQIIDTMSHYFFSLRFQSVRLYSNELRRKVSRRDREEILTALGA